MYYKSRIDRGKQVTELTELTEYERFIRSKNKRIEDAGFEPVNLPEFLFPFQREIVRRACVRGRSAIFAECGLGKTGMQLAWADQVVNKTGGRVLVLAPLAVSGQTIREGEKFGIKVRYASEQKEVDSPITITNYERLKNFDPSKFVGVVLDESGILKAYSGTTKRQIIQAFSRTEYRLACSATPAPNDIQELGNHAEFLGLMLSSEMIARWFCTTFDAGKFRLKGHAVKPFWEWVNSWSVMCAKPSDVGPFDDSQYELPLLDCIPVVVDVDTTTERNGMLFRDPGISATKIHAERRLTASDRVARIAELVASEPGEPWILWTETDYEGDELQAAIPEAGNLRGGLSLAAREKILEDFSTGKLRVLIAKPKIAGFGLNWQHCARVAFVAATYSFESFYQAVRRTWRFGQTRPVKCYLVSGTTEAHVSAVLQEKMLKFDNMREMMASVAPEGSDTSSKVLKYSGEKQPEMPSWLKGVSQ